MKNAAQVQTTDQPETGAYLMKNLIAALTIAAFATPAMAAERCGPRPAVLEHLADKYGESRRTIGMMGNGAVLEIFASTTNGTWTATVTRPDGMTCLVASGTAFEGFLPTPEGVEG